MSAGEPVEAAVFAWAQNRLEITINEMFGQTEMNYIVGHCAGCWPARAGSMGRPHPGHRMALIDEQGRVGSMGEVALNRRDIHGPPRPAALSRLLEAVDRGRAQVQ